MGPVTETHVAAGDGARLRCLTAGDGPNTLILIPGWTMAADVFERQFERLAGDGLRVVSFDPRGQGGSTKDFVHHDYDTRGDDVAAVVETCASGPVVLASWSQGTFEHLSFVRRHGHDRTVGSIIIDGAPRHVVGDTSREWGWLETRPDAPSEINLAAWIVNPTTDRTAFNKEFIAWMLEDPAPEAVDWFDTISRRTPDGIASLLNGMAIPLDFQPEVSLLAATQPTLIVVRDEWRRIVSDWVHAHAPNARLATMAKHASFWCSPDHFNDLVLGFLTGAVAWSGS
ncbi:MAG TPA: alpha/beta hydrolase [Solirubrobacteraceae bacterium]